LARGKKLYDKRQAIRKRDAQREMERTLAERLWQAPAVAKNPEVCYNLVALGMKGFDRDGWPRIASRGVLPS